jgi:hypothetical protein
MGDELCLLNDQLKCCRVHAQTVEPWKEEHDRAMACWTVDDLVSLLLFVLQRLRRHNTRWAQDVQKERGLFSWELARSFADAYRAWYETSQLALKAVDACQRHGFSVSEAAQLREESRQVALMSLDLDRVRRSIESLEAGRGIPFAQAMDELRHHLR